MTTAILLLTMLSADPAQCAPLAHAEAAVNTAQRAKHEAMETAVARETETR